MTFEKQKHFSLRKLKFGLVSVAIIAFLFAVTKTAEADETVITEQRQTSKINASSQKVENQTSKRIVQTRILKKKQEVLQLMPLQ